MSDSVRPHRWQSTRLPHPRDSPGKNAGVGCHFLFQCMKVKRESEVVKSCPTLSDPMDCSPPGPPHMGFSRQEYWSGVPLPSPTHILKQSNSDPRCTKQRCVHYTVIKRQVQNVHNSSIHNSKIWSQLKRLLIVE